MNDTHRLITGFIPVLGYLTLDQWSAVAGIVAGLGAAIYYVVSVIIMLHKNKSK